jgi:hypothetical protein
MDEGDKLQRDRMTKPLTPNVPEDASLNDPTTINTDDYEAYQPRRRPSVTGADEVVMGAGWGCSETYKYKVQKG